MENSQNTFAGSGTTTKPLGTEAHQSNPSEADSTGKHKIQEMAHQAKESLSHAKDNLTEKGASAMEHIKSTAKESSLEAKHFGRDVLSKQIGRVAGCFTNIETAATSAAERLREHNNAHLGEYAEKAASQCGRVSEYLTSHEPSELFQEVEGVVRRHPEVVLGALVVTGLIVGRFLKASNPKEHHTAQY